MKYLGRAAVTLSEEGYYIRITEKLEERAATNRYSIRPDLFLIGKNSSWEIYVVQDGRIAEAGTKGDLCAWNSLFAKMWQDYQSSVRWKVEKEGPAC